MSKVKDAPEEKKDKVVFSPEIYQREDGMFSFRINGNESMYRSSSADGIARVVARLLNGPSPSKKREIQAVRLAALKVRGKAKLGGKGEDAELVSTPDSWETLPTVEQRVEAFMTRGTLVKKEG